MCQQHKDRSPHKMDQTWPKHHLLYWLTENIGKTVFLY